MWVNIKHTLGLEKKIGQTAQDEWWTRKIDITVMYNEITDGGCRQTWLTCPRS